MVVVSLKDQPEFLTVPEAARVLRISRGLAYELARRFEATGGRDGLPVLRLGRALRVPRGQLEALVDGTTPVAPVAPEAQPAAAPTPVPADAEPAPPAPSNADVAPQRRSRRPRSRSTEPASSDALTLFPASNGHRPPRRAR